MAWEITWCRKEFIPAGRYQDREARKEAQQKHNDKFTLLLKEWEPFSAEYNEVGNIIHFRRQIR